MSYDLATVQRVAMERHINQVVTNAALEQEALQAAEVSFRKSPNS